MQSSARPMLCVDLDGTLIKSDLLQESLLKLIKSRPWLVLCLPFWLLRGRAFMKHQIAMRTEIDVSLLPYREDVVTWCRSESEHRRVVLATGSPQKFADAVAAHLGFFDQALGSDQETNLIGHNKRQALEELSGSADYEYIGDSKIDLNLWRSCGGALLAGKASRRKSLRAEKINIVKVFASEAPKATTLLRAMRVHQWVKNLLIFVPLFTAKLYFDPTAWLKSGIAFLCFCFAASSVYLMNDLLDLEADRGHHKKRLRPFAAGDLPLSIGFVAAPGLALASLLTAWLLRPEFVLLPLGYLVLTSLYSIYLKRLALVDVISLAGLFTMRIFAGVAALDVALSNWLSAFSMFLFLSLAFVKRFAELKNLRAQGGRVPAGRGYRVEDDQMIANLGVASGFASVLVFALYINSPRTLELYANPDALWLFAPLLLYWISRVWMIASRGMMDEDPIVWAVKDKASYVLGLLALVIVLLATYPLA